MSRESLIQLLMHGHDDSCSCCGHGPVSTKNIIMSMKMRAAVATIITTMKKMSTVTTIMKMSVAVAMSHRRARASSRSRR